jgi:hypothetical protein
VKDRRQRLLPKPPEPPEGMMWFYWGLVPIEEAEEHARGIMGNFDELPRKQRDRLNFRGDAWKRKKRSRR